MMDGQTSFAGLQTTNPASNPLQALPTNTVGNNDNSGDVRLPHKNIFRIPAGEQQDAGNLFTNHRSTINHHTSALNQPLRAWLETKGLGKYAECFEKVNADLSLVPYLAETDLQAMGVATLGGRKKIMLAAAELIEGEQQQNPASSLAKTHGIAAYFPIMNKQPDGTMFAYPPPGKRPIQGNTSTAAAPARKKTKTGWVHDAVRQETNDTRKRGWRGPKAAAVLPIKSWQLVPGCPSFVVDRFCNVPPSTTRRHFFLTHFHADHYKGLTSKWQHGTIYCTPETAALVQQQLRVPSNMIQRISIGEPFVIDGVKVTCIDANHCPGSVMMLFEPAGRPPVLHSGDCRLVPRMQQDPLLSSIKQRAILVLDTTYADPQYTFPSQEEVIEFAVDAVKAEAFNSDNTLFMFGSYTIGKERLFLEVAQTLNKKLYMSATKKKIFDCLQLEPYIRQLVTTDDSETNMHVVPMWMISQKHMANALKFYRGRFTTVVGFKPTGWTHERDAEQTKRKGRRKQKGTIVTYQVPYSEHSSFTELRQFVAWLQPQRIIPSVNSDEGGPKAEKLVRLVRGI